MAKKKGRATKPASRPSRHSQTQTHPVAHFSLRDEARYMSNHRSSAFESSTKLRHLPVAFVSAGCLLGSIPDKIPQTDPLATCSSLPANTTDSADALAQMTIRSPSPSPSAASTASSEERIVFRGRARTPLPRTTPPSRSTEADSAPSTAPLLATQPAVPDAAPLLATRPVVPDAAPLLATQPSVPWESRSKPGVGRLPVQDRPRMDDFDKVDPRDAAMDDYAQNAEANGMIHDMLAIAGFGRRELDLDAGSHNDWESDQDLEVPSGMEPDDGWTSDQARDLDDLSTSDEVHGIVVRITGRRTRSHGLQYQVIYEGYTRDDARWIPAVNLTTPSDKILIEAYEVKLLAREEQHQQQGSSTSDSEVEYVMDGESSEEDVEVDDEQLARAWQKQEEMGIDDDELVLYAADAYFSDLVGAVGTSRSTTKQSNTRRQQRFGSGRRGDPTFPSASAMADAIEMDPYAGFDIMDTERPSLRLKKKGRKGQMPPELAGDDSDLNEQMQATWATDRAKKRLKKAEREELRKQGLLGRKGKGPDLSVKYKDGFVLAEVVEEIRDFWADDDAAILSLPTMEAHRRAVLHQFVKEFRIQSKSQGDGAKRHTILSKSVRTLAFDDDFFDRMQKKYARRLHIVGKYGPPLGKEKAPKASKNRPAVSYKDGEVVGAKAPELGTENKGRAMLEKMGWSKGMALGAMDNKGILQPITHTVKITKAGLR